MSHRPTLLLLSATLAFGAGCSRDGDPPADPAAPAAAPAPTPPPAPEAPPQPAPTAPAPVPEASPAPPAAPAGTDSVTGFHGFGPARFGDAAEAVRIAWGRPLVADRQTTPDTPCVYLNPDPEPSAEMRIAFMLDYDKFVRYDVSGTGYEAPGGGRVGNHRDALVSMYGDTHTLVPHKYVEGGQYFIVPGPDGSNARLVFELDAEGMVTEWRVGTPPQVDYVEGCG
jgi:hypothetical protein